MERHKAIAATIEIVVELSSALVAIHHIVFLYGKSGEYDGLELNGLALRKFLKSISHFKLLTSDSMSLIDNFSLLTEDSMSEILDSESLSPKAD